MALTGGTWCLLLGLERAGDTQAHPRNESQNNAAVALHACRNLCPEVHTAQSTKRDSCRCHLDESSDVVGRHACAPQLHSANNVTADTPRWVVPRMTGRVQNHSAAH